jgi:hypothetical protein
MAESAHVELEDGSTDGHILEFLLSYAVRAPSSHNTQPWRFELDAHHVELYAHRSRALSVVDPQDRELVMSCGALLAHVEVVMRAFGFAGLQPPPPAAEP